jgi:hypothetical protein
MGIQFHRGNTGFSPHKTTLGLEPMISKAYVLPAVKMEGTYLRRRHYVISKYTAISLFPKEITVHSGIVWRDKIYGDRRQICERVEVSTINILDDQK